MRNVDLRSDTVTLPSPAMRRAMVEAELGDDVFEDDPTVIRLEKRAAELLGKEAGLFTASGTMSNLVALLTHCERGAEVIMGDQAHTFLYEVGGAAALGSITTRTVPNQPDGSLKLEDVAAAVRGDNIHFPRTRAIVIENTHNRMGGTVLSVDYTDRLGALAHQKGLQLHLDGARIFNAAVALRVDARELTRGVDSVCFCLSKGLACPIGSVLCGPRDFIAEARRYRKMVGGGMRQVGVLAAAGLVALDQMIDRLAEDHENARYLAEGLAALAGIHVNLESVQTNIVMFDWVSGKTPAADLLPRFLEKGVRFIQLGERRFRLVTHYGIDRSDIDYALEVFRAVTATAA